jgi:FlaG/FlaF family flagellin (archaellin)
MYPRGLIIAICVGILAGAILGILIIEMKTTSQLVFVEGTSISIVTEKTDFKKGEDISIRIVNSGTVPLTFSDASYGLRITQLDGIETYSPISAQVISVLEPKEEITFVWDQIKNDGDEALQGVYKITSSGLDPEQKTIKKSITINIFK